MPVIEAEALHCAIGGTTALELASWTVDKGAHTLVLGPSGCGKTTLLHLIAGLRTPSSGRLRVLDTDLAGLRPAARDAFRGRHLGIVFQTLHLIGAISVAGNLRLARRLARLPADEARIDAALAAVGLEGKAGRRPSSLSQGEAQRAAIARAVVVEPDLLLADEPTAALDDTNCGRVADLLLEAAADCAATLVVATHDRRLAGRFAHRLELEAAP